MNKLFVLREWPVQRPAVSDSTQIAIEQVTP
jgi:hypothetical protein